MKKAALVAFDLWREALARKWVLALVLGITLVLAGIASALRLDVIDGALAATRIFGADLNTDVRAVDVALRPVFQVASYLVFYGGLLLSIVATADFGPSLLSPGRIELLLAQPVRRAELYAGTYAGVIVLSLACGLYGGGGFSLLLGLKTGVWVATPLLAGVGASIAFAALYGVMLLVASIVRSASLSALAGGALFVLGMVAGYRDVISQGLSEGLARTLFSAVTLALPRLSTFADILCQPGRETAPWMAIRLGSGLLLFGLAASCVGIWHFNRRDF